MTHQPLAALAATDIFTEVRLADGRRVPVAGHVDGPPDAPAVLVLGGVSAHRRAARWWAAQCGPGKALDTSRVRVIGADFLGEAAAPFPSTEDQARAALAVADAAGVDRFAVIGASYGGMIAQHIAALAPERVSEAVIISAAERAAPLARAWRSIQRETVELALRHGDGAAGVDIARRLAMTTYRTPGEIDRRFRDAPPDSRDAAGPEAWLAARGADYAAKVSPQRFLALSRSMDAHEADAARIACPAHFVAVAGDLLVPAEDVAAAAGRAAQGRLSVLCSPFGHDAFLKEEAAFARLLAPVAERAR
ncbi:MAG: alpha/beta fold hydrolase [Maricaulaceae bacterium]|nr:alpha/beta fold hydrolase [Maricaulaceae bacterium]